MMLKKIFIFFMVAIFLLVANVIFIGSLGASNYLPAWLSFRYLIYAFVIIDLSVFVALIYYIAK
jgi:hypothetical protein